MTTVKSTVNIYKTYKDQLEELVKNKEISSITDGINLGIAMLIKEKNRELYARQMSQAAKDKDFVERTARAQEEFKYADGEVGQW